MSPESSRAYSIVKNTCKWVWVLSLLLFGLFFPHWEDWMFVFWFFLKQSSYIPLASLKFTRKTRLTLNLQNKWHTNFQPLRSI